MGSALQRGAVAVSVLVLVLALYSLARVYTSPLRATPPTVVGPEREAALYTELYATLSMEQNALLERAALAQSGATQSESLDAEADSLMRRAEGLQTALDVLVSEMDEAGGGLREARARRLERVAASESNSGWSNELIKLLAKLLFSLLLGVAALYIVLSNKYPDDTQKWAFSVLSLIAGVWIGTL